MIRKMVFSLPVAAAFWAAVFLSALLCGCNEYERRGVSPLPQNRPAGWETNPYGPVRN